MAIYTLKVEQARTGDEHIVLGIYKDATKLKERVFTRDELLNSPIDFDNAILFFIRQTIKAAGATYQE